MAPQIVSKKSRDRRTGACRRHGSHNTRFDALMMAQERELRAKLRELRDHNREERRHVGERFPQLKPAKCITAIIEHRPIYGEASPEEARSLIDEGVEVSPLPVVTGRPELTHCVIPGTRLRAKPNPEIPGSLTSLSSGRPEAGTRWLTPRK